MYKIESEADGGSGPKGPNFKLIVMLAAVAILVAFGIALLMIPSLARRIHLVNPDAHPTSQLQLRRQQLQRG